MNKCRTDNPDFYDAEHPNNRPMKGHDDFDYDCDDYDDYDYYDENKKKGTDKKEVLGIVENEILFETEPCNLLFWKTPQEQEPAYIALIFKKQTTLTPRFGINKGVAHDLKTWLYRVVKGEKVQPMCLRDTCHGGNMLRFTLLVSGRSKIEFLPFQIEEWRQSAVLEFFNIVDLHNWLQRLN